MDFEKAIGILNKGIQDELFSCYAVSIGRGEEIFYTKAEGNASVYPKVRPLENDALFDIASMTKLVGTAMATLRLFQLNKIDINARIGEFITNCHQKEEITLKQLLTHTSGVSAHMPLWRMNIKSENAVDTILSQPLVKPIGCDVVYSCMGYIVLGKILETVISDSLDNIIESLVLKPLKMKDTMFCPTSKNCVSTEYSKEDYAYICGKVHDENARFLGGVAGNAGLFSTISDITKFASMLSLRGKDFLEKSLFEEAVKNHTPFANESRGLGFHLFTSGLFPTGKFMSKGSYGHTGFTGTSLFVDNKSGVYVALLTNRVHFGRDNNEFFTCRRLLHDAVFKNGV